MAVGANNLTNLDRVKKRLGITGTANDTMLEQFIDEVSEGIERYCGRIFREQTYTEYYDGNSSAFLGLRQGPLASVTSVNFVEYSDGGGGIRTETLTEIEKYQRLEGGLRSLGYPGLAWLERNDGSPWMAGRQNYKVIYIAGFADTADTVAIGAPEAVIHWATFEVTWVFKSRENPGALERQDIGSDIDRRWISPKQFDDARARALGPYIARGAY